MTNSKFEEELNELREGKDYDGIADKWLEYVLWARKFYESNVQKMTPIFQECTEELSRDPNFYQISNTLRVFIYYVQKHITYFFTHTHTFTFHITLF